MARPRAERSGELERCHVPDLRTAPQGSSLRAIPPARRASEAVALRTNSGDIRHSPEHTDAALMIRCASLLLVATLMTWGSPTLAGAQSPNCCTAEVLASAWRIAERYR